MVGLGAGGAAKCVACSPSRRREMYLHRGVGDGCDVRAGDRGAARWLPSMAYYSPETTDEWMRESG